MSREAHVPFYERLGVQLPRSTQRFSLSFRDVEDLLAERGVIVSYESIRQWCLKFGRVFARSLRRHQGRLGDTWFMDEVFITIGGETHYLWRAVDQDGDVLDILVQKHRNKRAAKVSRHDSVVAARIGRLLQVAEARCTGGIIQCPLDVLDPAPRWI